MARGSQSILEAVADAELAAELTMQPVRRYGVDAAILFSDIVVPVSAVGFGVEVVAGRGPVVERPFRSSADLHRLRPLLPEQDTPYVLDTIKLVVDQLKGVPLIGFAGAPFTVASYLVEGGPSRQYSRTKALMYGDPALFAALLDVLADMALAFLQAQVAAGASAVQLFDSWVGVLSPEDYTRFVLPASTKVLGALAEAGVPRIHFGVGTGELLALMARAGADVVGVDWRVPLDEARRRLPPGLSVQGNLDPALCLAPWDTLAGAARGVLEAGGGRGHVFNLGHGVLPETEPEALERLVDLVHAWPVPEPGQAP